MVSLSAHRPSFHHTHACHINGIGFLNKSQFAAGFREITGSADPDMIDQFFNAFDYDKDGQVDFRDFACGLGVLHKYVSFS
jgi:Ca2+-binding EF-hand superfamily protein